MTGPTRRVDGVLFDKDGTLFDFDATWSAWAEALLADLAGEDGELAERVAGAVAFDRTARRFAPHSPVIAGTPEDAARLIAPVLGRESGELIATINDAAAMVAVVPPVPLAPLLSRLKADGLWLGVATNDARAPAEAHLDKAGVRGVFDFVTGSDGAYAPKPGPDMCLGFAETVGLPPSRVVMVGDSTHDLEAGRAAGMRTVGVLTGPATRSDLAPLADCVLDHIGQLPGWIGLD